MKVGLRKARPIPTLKERSRCIFVRSAGSVHVREAEGRGEFDTGERYYEHWLTAVERLVVEKNLTGMEDLTKEGEEIRGNDHHRREHQLKGGA